MQRQEVRDGELLRLTRAQARRVAVRAQLLDRPGPTDVLDVVRRLTLVQVDLTAAVAPHAEVLLWSRLGSRGFAREDLDRLVTDRSLVELDGLLRPADDVRLYRAEMAAWRSGEPPEEWQRGAERWMSQNHVCREGILQELLVEGPLPARALPDTCVVPWRSSGWTAGKNTMKMLEIMACRGEVAVSHRERRERVWDLAERVYPDSPAAAPSGLEASRERDRRRLEALGLARATAPKTPNEPDHVGEAGVEVEVDGVAGRWRVDPEQLRLLEQPFQGRTALLSPLDRLVFDRRRIAEIFDYDYTLEMYKPAAQRRWGYWAMPVLHGDRLVGKVDAAADRRGGALRLAAVHQDVPFSPATVRAVDRELRDLAAYLDLALVDERDRRQD